MNSLSPATFIFALVMSPLCSQGVWAAPPLPTVEFQNALSSQTTRVMAGEKDLTQFMRDLTPIADSGDPVAKFYLAALIANSNKNKAINMFRESADAGCMGAAGVLGGLLMASKPEEAKAWRIRAAFGGDALSQVTIAGLNYKGDKETPKDKSAALAWARLASIQMYSKGGAQTVERFIDKLQHELSREELARSEELFVQLNKAHPKQPFYVCGQSLP